MGKRDLHRGCRSADKQFFHHVQLNYCGTPEWIVPRFLNQTDTLLVCGKYLLWLDSLLLNSSNQHHLLYEVSHNNVHRFRFVVTFFK